MAEHLSAMTNLIVVIVLAMISLFGLTLFVPYYGMLPMILVFITMMLTSFFTSNYLNKITEPKQRATVLSYKGLAFNAAYGVIGIFYAGLIASLRNSTAGEDEAFRQSIDLFPSYLFAILLLIIPVCFFHFRRFGNTK
jgi:predicted MFS family arabinose efflux permease